MYLDKEKSKTVNSFLNKSFLKKLLFVGRGLDKAEAVTDYINADYRS